jgi:hypothetical protein
VWGGEIQRAVGISLKNVLDGVRIVDRPAEVPNMGVMVYSDD